MGSIDPILVFKQHFNREEVGAVVSALIHHKPVWKQLKEETCLNAYLQTIPHQKEFWSAAHLCLHSAGIDARQAISEEQLRQISHNAGISDLKGQKLAGLGLDQVAAAAAYLLLEGQKPAGWGHIFNSGILPNISQSDIAEGWGTIISVVFFLAETRAEMLFEMGESESAIARQILAFVLANNGDMLRVEQDELQNWIERASPQNFIKLMGNLDFHENKLIQKQLAGSYLERHLSADTKRNDPPSDLATDELLQKIAILKDYATLAVYADCEDQAREFSSKATRLVEMLNRNLENLKKGLAGGLMSDARFSPASEFEEAELDFSSRALQAMAIKDSDAETARKIAKGLFQDVKASRNFQEIMPFQQAGMPVSPAQLVNLLAEINLIPEAAKAAEILMNYQPLNSELLKAAADLCYSYGDFEKASNYYSRLEITRELVREEKAHLADCLEKLGRWTDALIIWKKINAVSLEDFQKMAICCYRAGDEQTLAEVIQAAANFYNSEGLFQALNALFKLNAGQKEEAQALVEKIHSSRKRDVYTIQFLIEYWLTAGQYNMAKEFLASLSSLEADLPEIVVKYFEVSQRISDAAGVQACLEKCGNLGIISDIGTLATLIEACLSADAGESARKLLSANGEKWVLSPWLQGAKARLLIERGNYNPARDILRELISREQIQADWLIDFGLATAERKRADFPLAETLARSQSNLNASSLDEKFFNQNYDHMLLKVLQAEMEPERKLTCYQALMTRADFHRNPDAWRVYAGMGKYYFQNKQYDLAVVNFKEALKLQPQKRIISLFLIQAFAKMRLYEDALDVVANCMRAGGLEIMDLLEINTSLKDIQQWQRMLEEKTSGDGQSTIFKYALAQLYLGQNQTDKALRLIRSCFKAGLPQSADRFAAAQLLAQVGMHEEAGQVIDDFLTENELISADDYLASAFINMQIGQNSKALNLLNLIEQVDYAILGLKAFLYQETGFPAEAQAANRQAIDLYEMNSEEPVVIPYSWLTAPHIWEEIRQNPLQLYQAAIINRKKNGDLTGAFEDAQAFLVRFPADFNLLTLALSLAYSLGEEKIIESFLDNATAMSLEECANDGVCIWGEAALKLGREIQAANLLSQCLEILPDSLRVKALQARLQHRNGNHADAQALLDEMLKGAHTISDTGMDDASWLAEAALELGRYQVSMEKSRQAIQQSGQAAPFIEVFLRALSKITFENWINQRLQAAAHVVVLDKQDLELFESFQLQINSGPFNRPDLQSQIREIQMWLDEAGAAYREIEDDPYTSSCARLVACFKQAGGNKAEILLEKYRDGDQLPLVFALLTMDTEPAKALAYLTGLLKTSAAQAQHYAALAIVKQKLGQPEDAYAAISLALSAWPEEYQWHILAGEISKAVGDVHASLNHFQKAAEIEKGAETQAYLGEMNLQAGNYLGIAYLESRLNGDERDFDTLIKLGELSMRNEKPQKAARYLENAKRIRSQDSRPYLMISQLALKLGNLKKAQDNLEMAYLLDPQDQSVIGQKAAIIRESQGAQAALDFLGQDNLVKIKPGKEILLRKAAYIAELQGEQRALDYLIDKTDQSNDAEIQLEIARLQLKTGDLEAAENNADLARQSNPGNPYPLQTLAKAAQQNGDLDKAIDLLVKAVQLNPFEPAFFMDLARIYQTRRDNRQALEILESGVRTNPYHFDLLKNLGLLYYQQGSYQPAEICLRQAIKIRLGDESIKSLLSTLKNANIIQIETSNPSVIEE